MDIQFNWFARAMRQCGDACWCWGLEMLALSLPHWYPRCPQLGAETLAHVERHCSNMAVQWDWRVGAALSFRQHLRKIVWNLSGTGYQSLVWVAKPLCRCVNAYSVTSPFTFLIGTVRQPTTAAAATTTTTTFTTSSTRRTSPGRKFRKYKPIGQEKRRNMCL